MPCAALILVETAFPGNLGAALRVAANFGVGRVHLVRPKVSPEEPEVRRWACGAQRHLEIAIHEDLSAAAGGYRVLLGTASSRGRVHLPVISPPEAVTALRSRPLMETALVFGNETRGLSRKDLDRCDLVVRIPTAADFPVLNITQAIAILLAYLSIELERPTPSGPEPASQESVEGLMSHLRRSLLSVGFLDPVNPQRTLRKLRRLLGRAGVTDNEVAILHGICRQMEWAVKQSSTRLE